MKINDVVLFEFGEPAAIQGGRELEQVARDAWDNWSELFEGEAGRYEGPESDEDAPASSRRRQPFLTFDADSARARNFVGFMQTSVDRVEIYPKVFAEAEASASARMLMLEHILFWLGHCKRFKFPFDRVSLAGMDFGSLPELLIYIIATNIRRAVTEHPLQTYQPLEESLRTPRGSINFKRYVTNSLSHGNAHIIECDHEPFAFDNALNRTIKYCTRLLISQTGQSETLRMLEEIIFVLDDVEDQVCTVQMLDQLRISPFFDDYRPVINHCRFILEQAATSNESYDLQQWSFLLPMEVVFEDFIAGFIIDKFAGEGIRVSTQRSDIYLSDEPRAFQLRHDIMLTARGKQLIIDTKYKLRHRGWAQDVKRGIAQSDMYQMLSYAYRRGCTDVMLIYPNLHDSPCAEPDSFTITSPFTNQPINIHALEAPFWSLNDFSTLEEELEKRLRDQLTRFGLID